MKVVNFIPVGNQVCQNTIETLELMLKEAKEGKLQSFIGITLYNNMDMEHVKAGAVYDNYISFMGMLSDFQIDFKDDYEENSKWKR